MRQNSINIIGLFPLANIYIQVSSNSRELMNLFFKKFHCIPAEKEGGKSMLKFSIHQKLTGEYLLSCPLIKFELLINNRSLKEKQWCVIETVKTLSYYYYSSKNTLFLHGSAIVYKGNGYIFSGISGSGKSTISNKFDPHSKIADDQVIVKKIKGVYYLFSSIFDQKLRYPNFKGTPLKKIYFIGKSNKLIIKQLNKINMVLSRLMMGDLFNSIFEFYLNQSKGDNRLHLYIAQKTYTPSYKNNQLKNFLTYAREILFFNLSYDKKMEGGTLLKFIA